MEASTSRKRTFPHSWDEDIKKFRFDDIPHNEEGVYNVQQIDAGDITEVVTDSGDANDSSSSMTEYEVTHLESNRNPALSTEESDEIDEIAELGAVAVKIHANLSDIDLGQLADSSTSPSTSPSSNSDADPELPRQDLIDYWTCIKCKAVVKNRHVPFCNACFSYRKTFYNERMRRKRIIRRTNTYPMSSSVSRTVTRSASVTDMVNYADTGDVVDGPIRTKSLGKEQSTVVSTDKDQTLQDATPTVGSHTSNITINIEGYSSSAPESVDEVDKKTKAQDIPKNNLETVNQKNPVSNHSMVVSGKSITYVIGETPEEIITNNSPTNVKCVKFPFSLCQLCGSRPADAGFAHRSSIHTDFACYFCARRAWRESAYCPLCRLKIVGVYRLI